MTQTAPQVVGNDPVVAEILAEAFSDDPFMAWIFGERERRIASLAVWWAWLIEHVPPGAEVWRTDDAAAGALWYPPRHVGDDPEPESADEPDPNAPNPFVEMLSPLVGDRIGEVLEMFAKGGELHPEEPHWYLLALGTRPSRQGEGLGAHVVRPVLDRCDQQGLGIYLESSNQRNIPFYHRLGFEITGELWTPDEFTVLTGMWRRPR